jgi:hypothetical protein
MILRFGAYYERMWEAAVKAKADVITVTSFNEWGEGTQIEPAISKTTVITTVITTADGSDHSRSQTYRKYADYMIERDPNVRLARKSKQVEFPNEVFVENPFLYLNLTKSWSSQFISDKG